MNTSVTADVLFSCSGAFRVKDIGNDLKEAIVAANQSTKGYKAIFKQSEVPYSTVRTIIHKWKTFNIITDLIRSGSL